MSINVTISVNGDLPEVAAHIEKTFGYNAINLLNYANSAPHVHKVNDSDWPIGSIFPNEYRLLYALVRAIRPNFAIEAGCYWGCSTTAILSALGKNEEGRLWSVDTMENMGGRIPYELRNHWLPFTADASEFFRSLGVSRPIAAKSDFFFEDTEHTRESTREIVGAAIPHMAQGALMICHDPVSRPEMLLGLEDLGIKPEIYLLEGSNCGLAIWRNQ